MRKYIHYSSLKHILWRRKASVWCWTPPHAQARCLGGSSRALGLVLGGCIQQKLSGTQTLRVCFVPESQPSGLDPILSGAVESASWPGALPTSVGVTFHSSLRPHL